MNKIKFAAVLAFVLVFVPLFATRAQNQTPITVFSQVDTIPEVHIDKTGKVSVQGAKVMQKAGTSYYVRLIWSESYIRILVKTAPGAEVVRRFGAIMSPTEINPGDYLNIDGEIESGSDSFIVKASKIRDLSDQKEMDEFSGTVNSFGTSTPGFLLNTQFQGIINVNVGTSTVIIKGSRMINLSSVHIGDKVSKIVGVFNHGNNTINATSMVVYVNMNTFKSRNFQGVLKTSPGNSLPATFIATIEGVDYTVNLQAGSDVWNNKRKTVVLSRFVVGDTIRLYGSIQESDSPIINASIVRNLDL
ncbi:MAG: hypothetical protein WCT19_01370 [Candidatus Paceibacterota bacterium]